MKTPEKNGSAAVAPLRALRTRRAPAAYIAPGVSYRGRLVHTEMVRVDGAMEGEIETEGTVLIGEGAFVKARVRAGTVVCAGTLTGDVIATGRVELRATAVLDGGLWAPMLLIEEGAQVNGTVAVGVEA